MKIQNYLFATAIVSIFLSSCVSTQIGSFYDPDTNFSKYQKIVVYATIQNIEWRKALEKIITDELANKGKNAVPSINIISPLKTYSQEEIISIYENEQIDCIISVSLLSASIENQYIPQTVHTYDTTRFNGEKIVSEQRSYTTGGYALSFPQASFEIIVSESKTNKIVMKSTAYSEGDEFSNMNTIFESLAKKIVEEYLSNCR